MDYKELEVWKEGRKLVVTIYDITKAIPKAEMYGLTAQMRRSAVSVSSNIAEGCGRRTSADTIQFLHISRGSLYELETQLFLAMDQTFINQQDFDTVTNQILTSKKLINGFINYHKK